MSSNDDGNRLNWSMIGWIIFIFICGYVSGSSITKEHWEKKLEEIIRTDSILFEQGKISLGLTEEKRREILNAMESAIAEQNKDNAQEGYDPRR